MAHCIDTPEQLLSAGTVPQCGAPFHTPHPHSSPLYGQSHDFLMYVSSVYSFMSHGFVIFAFQESCLRDKQCAVHCFLLANQSSALAFLFSTFLLLPCILHPVQPFLKDFGGKCILLWISSLPFILVLLYLFWSQTQLCLEFNPGSALKVHSSWAWGDFTKCWGIELYTIFPAFPFYFWREEKWAQR